MSDQEVKRLQVMGQLVERVITQGQAADRLGLSKRQVRRLLRRYERQGQPDW